MSQVETIRIADASLERGKYSWVWVVPKCPYCGKRHEHYGGALDGDPYKYIGQTITAQCDKTARRQLSPGDPAIPLHYALEPAIMLADEVGRAAEGACHELLSNER